MTRPHIFIVGYYGFRNLGDEAVLSAMLGDLRERLEDPPFTVTSGEPELTTRDHGVAAVAWQDLPSIIEAVRAADLVVIGGGGLFHDYWGADPASVLSKHHYGISYCATPAVLAALRRVPLMIYGVGVGPLLSDDARQMTRAVFDLAAAATVRDAESRGELEKLGVAADRVEVTADAAFGLPSPTTADIAAAATLTGGPGDGPLIGVCLRGWNVDIDQSTLLTAVAGALDDFVEANDARVMLVPFSDLEEDLADDTSVARDLAGMIGPHARVTVCDVPATPAAARALLSRCDLVLGMRLHSLLFSATLGVPVVALAYDPKVTRLMTALGADDWCLALAEAGADAIRGRLEDAYGHRHEIGRRLKTAAETLGARAVRSAELAAGLVTGGAYRPTEYSKEAWIFLQTAVEGAVIRGEEKATSAEKLVTQRDWLLEQKEMLTAQRDAVAVERDALSRERDVLEEQQTALQTGLSDLEKRHEEQAETLLATEFQLQQITGSRSYRLISMWWRARVGLNRALRGAYSAVIPDSLRQRMRHRRYTSGLLPGMNWYVYAFDRFKRARAATIGGSARGVGSPGVPGLVSIVLPVYNGGNMVRESLDSILAQTYPDFEIIAIDDGSTDDTGAILDEYARRDERVRVVHQENRKIPRTLSRGFRMARGEFLTWTSADNRCKPTFVESMVGCLKRHPDWDMVYANPDIIGDDGRPLRGSEWYPGYQVPAGSEHIHLPTDPSELNVYPNNYVGAAFIYRSRVAWLLGDYSERRFTTEDYDYWMRVNELLGLRHADFDDTVYDYRFHDSSLTARDQELGITSGRVQLMVFDDFRRDALLTPALWRIDHVGDAAGDAADTLRRRVKSAGHQIIDADTGDFEDWPRLFLTAIAVHIVSGDAPADSPPEHLPPGCLRVLALVDGVAGTSAPAPPDGWDLCIRVGSDVSSGPSEPYRLWLGVTDIDALFAAAEIRARSAQFEAVERAASESPSAKTIDATVVICTHKAIGPLGDSVMSVVRQTTDGERYEIILVNNNPGDAQLEAEIFSLRQIADGERPGLLRVLRCPIPGLSHARNAAIAEARGEVIICLDDDAIARNSLISEAVRLFRERPQVGVIGGHIRLIPPDPAPEVLSPGWERYWSQLLTDAAECCEVEHWWEFPWGACWCARRDLLLAMGGFRSGYGRVGNDYSGGEEVIAASLAQKLGYRVAVAPELEVEHRVEASRYTWRHVRQTIIAGTLVAYQAQRDLYLPMWEGIGSTLKKLLSPSFDRTVGANSFSARARHWFYRKEAWLQLLGRQIGDRVRRMRRPVSRRNG